MTSNELEQHIQWLNRLGVLALSSLVLVILAVAIQPDDPNVPLVISDMVLAMPLICYFVLLIVWHSYPARPAAEWPLRTAVVMFSGWGAVAARASG